MCRHIGPSVWIRIKNKTVSELAEVLIVSWTITSLHRGKTQNHLSSVGSESRLRYQEHGRTHNLLTQTRGVWLTGLKFAQFPPGGEWGRDKPGLNPDHVYVLLQRNVLKAPSTPAKHFSLALMFLRTSHESSELPVPRRHVITKINRPLTAFTEDHHDQLQASFVKRWKHTHRVLSGSEPSLNNNSSSQSGRWHLVADTSQCNCKDWNSLNDFMTRLGSEGPSGPGLFSVNANQQNFNNINNNYVSLLGDF